MTTTDVMVRARSFAVQQDEFAAFWARVAAGGWEPDSFALIDRFVTPGTTFVDIGAWIGPLTLYAASVACEVLAIEPAQGGSVPWKRRLSSPPRRQYPYRS